MTAWNLDASNGELLVSTGVTGPAAKMGHALTIAFTSWTATVARDGDAPAGVELTVDVDSLEVLRGEGGVKGLSGPEKALARSNALSSFDAKRFPRIVFRSDDVSAAGEGYRLDGTLEIHGKNGPRTVDVAVEDLGGSWRISGDAEVTQSEFGIKPYSMMMGAMKVVDAVTVSLRAEVPKS